jgi:deoxycytidylate deaminase
MSTPPDYVIEAARAAAIKSPCEKSKRGAALFNRERHDQWEDNPPPSFMLIGAATETRRDHVIAATGFNGQPAPFTCSGSDLCRRDCAQLCLHAEERAIRAAGALDDVVDLELVHVKVVNGEVVPGKGPGCAQCSRLIVETSIRGIWLFEQTDCPSEHCPMCTGDVCMLCDHPPRRPVPTSRDAPHNRGPVPRCEHASDERHAGRHPPQGEWLFRQPERFHRETLRNLKLGDRR